LSDQTLRQFVRLSVGGDRVRIRLSNETGSQPLVIGAAHLAIAGREKGSIEPSSDRVLTFANSPTITVPPGSARTTILETTFTRTMLATEPWPMRSI
jgi:hypothetical protein